MKDGELVRKYGEDALSLGVDPAKLTRYREAEVIHACWAILGTLGYLNVELLSKFSSMHFGEPSWFKAESLVNGRVVTAAVSCPIKGFLLPMFPEVGPAYAA